MDVGEGFVDILRLGRGIAEGGWKGLRKDALRALAIFGGLGRAAKGLAPDGRAALSAAGRLERRTKQLFANSLLADETGAIILRASKSTPKLLGPPIKFSPKIQKQLPKRGWTQQKVQGTIERPYFFEIVLA